MSDTRKTLWGDTLLSLRRICPLLFFLSTLTAETFIHRWVRTFGLLFRDSLCPLLIHPLGGSVTNAFMSGHGTPTDYKPKDGDDESKKYAKSC